MPLATDLSLLAPKRTAHGEPQASNEVICGPITNYPHQLEMHLRHLMWSLCIVDMNHIITDALTVPNTNSNGVPIV